MNVRVMIAVCSALALPALGAQRVFGAVVWCR